MAFLKYWKEIGLLILSVLGVSYVAKLKYDKTKAENTLAKVQIGVANKRTEIVKKQAEIAAGVKDIETSAEITALKELHKVEKEAREEVRKAVIADVEYKEADTETKKYIRARENALVDTF